MRDNQASPAMSYHEATKNWPGDNLARRVDPAIVPRPFKLYRHIEPLPLPAPRRSEEEAAATSELDIGTLAGLLHYSAGIMRRSTVSGRELVFRAASCTGAAYHIELYVVTAELPDLTAGVYHYDVQDEALRMLRLGDHRGLVADALCLAGRDSLPGAFIVATSTFWRNAWRYEARSYRHAFWDGGTVLANLLAVAAAHGLASRTLLGFKDDAINELLGVDSRREAALYVVGLGPERDLPATARPTPLPRIDAMPVSPIEIEYPLIYHTHAATSYGTCEEVRAWRSDGANGVALLAQPSSWPAPESLIERRGSTRRFRRRSISLNALRETLREANSAIRSDLGGRGLALTRTYVAVNAVEGLDAGKYRYDADSGRMELLERGEFRDLASHLALDQATAGEAAANVYYLADLDAVLSSLGDRGYRAAQLEGGVRGGRVYLAAQEQGLKASGLTFYDDEVIEFFNLTGSGMEPMFLIVVG